MSTILTKKNIIVGTDTQIQNRYANDPEGTIYLSTTKSKTYYDKELSIQTSSSGTASDYRPTLGFKNYSGNEVGSLQFHVGNNQMVFATNEQNEPGIQLALRAYNSSNAYSAKLPLTTNKAAAIGSGDVNLPLAVKVGSDTAVTANTGGVIELPAYPQVIDVEANPTVPSGTTPTSLTGLKVGNDYYEVSGGGGGGGGYLHNIIISNTGNQTHFFSFVFIDDVPDYTEFFNLNTIPASTSKLYQLCDKLGIIIDTTPGTNLSLSPIYKLGSGSDSIHALYLRPTHGLYDVSIQFGGDGAINASGNVNITQLASVVVKDYVTAL